MPLWRLSKNQMRQLETAISSVESHKPHNNKSVPILTQKALVNSLERTLHPDSVLDYDKADASMYRHVLKLHSSFVKVFKSKNKAPLEK